MRFQLDSDLDARKLATLNLPSSLWLFLSMNKEWPPFYRHAWGTAFVSTNDQGSDRFPVASLSLEIQMPSPGGTERDYKVAENVAEIGVDTKYYGAAAFGDFTSRWAAGASLPNYGEWSLVTEW